MIQENRQRSMVLKKTMLAERREGLRKGERENGGRDFITEDFKTGSY